MWRGRLGGAALRGLLVYSLFFLFFLEP